MHAKITDNLARIRASVSNHRGADGATGVVKASVENEQFRGSAGSRPPPPPEKSAHVGLDLQVHGRKRFIIIFLSRKRAVHFALLWFTIHLLRKRNNCRCSSLGGLYAAYHVLGLLCSFFYNSTK